MTTMQKFTPAICFFLSAALFALVLWGAVFTAPPPAPASDGGQKLDDAKLVGAAWTAGTTPLAMGVITPTGTSSTAATLSAPATPTACSSVTFWPSGSGIYMNVGAAATTSTPQLSSNMTIAASSWSSMQFLQTSGTCSVSIVFNQ